MKKLLMILSLAVSAGTVCGQKISDSAILNMTDQQLGVHLLQKSKNQKTAGYTFAGIAVASFIALPFVFEDEFMNEPALSKSLALYSIGFGSTITSLALLSAGNKNAGKAQMLTRTKSPDEVPGYELDMGIYYKKKATRQKIIGITLLAGGYVTTMIANKQKNYESESSGNTTDIVIIGGTVAMLASLPILVGAAKNNGRASVLLKKEIIPFSYYSKPIGLNSVALSIPIGNSR